MKINSLVTFRLIHKVELRSILHRIVNLWVKKSDQVHSFLPTKLFSNGFEVSGSMNSGACLNQDILHIIGLDSLTAELKLPSLRSDRGAVINCYVSRAHTALPDDFMG